MATVWHLCNIVGPRQLKLARLFPPGLRHRFLDLAARGPHATVYEQLGFRRYHWEQGFYGAQAATEFLSLLGTPALAQPDALRGIFLHADTAYVVLHYSPYAVSPLGLNVALLVLPLLANLSRHACSFMTQKLLVQWDDLAVWSGGAFSSLERELWEISANHVHVGAEMQSLVEHELGRPGAAPKNTLALPPAVPGDLVVPSRRPRRGARLRAAYMGGFSPEQPTSHRNYLPLFRRLHELGVQLTVLLPEHLRSPALVSRCEAEGWEVRSVATTCGELLSVLGAADIGICGFNNPKDAGPPTLRQRALDACSPNKLYEYLAARLPILSWNADNLAATANAFNVGTGLSIASSALPQLTMAQLQHLAAAPVDQVPTLEDSRAAFCAFVDRAATPAS